MRYLFGDSTPFPYAENFLVTLCAATDCCVAVLHADERAEEGNRIVRDAESRVNKELASLAILARRVEENFGADPPVVNPSPGPVQLAETRIAEQAWAMIKQARAEVLQLRDAAVLISAKSAPHAQVLPALSAFLTAHQLPETIWSIRWEAGTGGAPPVAEAYARTPFGLEATFEVEIPAANLWAKPVRVGQLEKDVTIRMMRKPWLRKPRLCPERLDKLFVAQITHTHERASMILKRSAKDRSEGIEIVLRSEHTTEVTATRLGRDGSAVGLPEALLPDDVAVVNRLWARVEGTIGELVCHRSRASAASLGGVPVGEILHPEAIAEVIIEAIAPIVREIAKRSGSPRELALKRTLGDGRREELFIAYSVVLERTESLSDRHQAMFDAFGLCERPQQRAVIRMLPPPKPASPPRPAPAAPVPPLVWDMMEEETVSVELQVVNG